MSDAVENRDEAGPDRFRRPERNRTLRRSRRRRLIRLGTGGTVVGVLALGLVVWAGAAGLRWLHATPLLAVRGFVVEGVHRAGDPGLGRILEAHRGRNLLALDLASVRHDLMGHPWVAQAEVRRVFPGTLAVRLIEREPVAVAVVDGTPTLVDREGTAIAPWSERWGKLDLPLITGAAGAGGGAPGERAAAVRAGLDALAALRDHDPDLLMLLSEVDVSQPDRLAARFVDEPAAVLLNRDDATRNLDHYLAVREDMRSRLPAVELIDLRWRGRVVVKPGVAETGTDAAGDEKTETRGKTRIHG